MSTAYPHWTVEVLVNALVPVVLCLAGYLVGSRHSGHALAAGRETVASTPPPGAHTGTVPAPDPLPGQFARDAVAEAAPLTLTTEEKEAVLRRLSTMFEGCVEALPQPCPERIVDMMCTVRRDLFDWVTDGDPLADEWFDYVSGWGRWR
jgi:hypothetical protein